MPSLSLFLLLLSCQPKPVETKTEVASRLTERLGTANVRILHQMQQIELYQLGEPDPTAKTVPGYSLEKEPMVLGEDSFGVVRSFLLDEQNYQFGVNVRCRLRPTHAFRIRLEQQSVQVLFSAAGNCPQIQFQGDARKNNISLSSVGREAFKVNVASILP